VVHYLVSWGDPNERLFDLTIRFTAPADNPRLLLPAWRPGRYLIQNYAANVREWSAQGDDERFLRVWKEGKSSWRVEAAKGEEIRFQYRYYAGTLDAGSSFLDPEEAYFNGSNLLMMVEGLRAEEQTLTVAAPAEWLVETQLPREDAADQEPDLTGTTFRARDYDHLIDSPVIAAGVMTRHTFRETEATIHLIFRGDEGIDSERFIDPVKAIVRSQAELFGGLPFHEYRFLIHVGDRWHGVEHEDSCSIVVRREELLGAVPGSEGFDHFLSICSHELFHAWNVKRLVPAVFSPYDYGTETPTRLLWFVEGLTSYYACLTLVRSGLWTVQRYLEHLAKEIETLEGLPAQRHQPLSQASFDAWLSDPGQMHDRGNASISFYNKGEIVSALLDLAIRRITDGAASLDDVVRSLWEEYGRTGKGLEEDAIESAVARVADVGDFFARLVDGVEPLPYEESFLAAGITFSAAARHPEEPSLAVTFEPENGSLVVARVLRGGAAMEAGVLPGDELIALGATRLQRGTRLASALRGLGIGGVDELLAGRGGVVLRLALRGRPDPRPVIGLRIEGASELRRGWLRREE
jgi:predicted metalloprotease with PDZ domain